MTDERKENDEHQRKADSRRAVSDWLLLISEAFIKAFILSCLLYVSEGTASLTHIHTVRKRRKYELVDQHTLQLHVDIVTVSMLKTSPRISRASKGRQHGRGGLAQVSRM